MVAPHHRRVRRRAGSVVGGADWCSLPRLTAAKRERGLDRVWEWLLSDAGQTQTARMCAFLEASGQSLNTGLLRRNNQPHECCDKFA